VEEKVLISSTKLLNSYPKLFVGCNELCLAKHWGEIPLIEVLLASETSRQNKEQVIDINYASAFMLSK
jgi:hypothetical protein